MSLPSFHPDVVIEKTLATSESVDTLVRTLVEAEVLKPEDWQPGGLTTSVTHGLSRWANARVPDPTLGLTMGVMTGENAPLMRVLDLKLVCSDNTRILSENEYGEGIELSSLCPRHTQPDGTTVLGAFALQRIEYGYVPPVWVQPAVTMLEQISPHAGYSMLAVVSNAIHSTVGGVTPYSTRAYLSDGVDEVAIRRAEMVDAEILRAKPNIDDEDVDVLNALTLRGFDAQIPLEATREKPTRGALDKAASIATGEALTLLFATQKLERLVKEMYRLGRRLNRERGTMKKGALDILNWHSYTSDDESTPGCALYWNQDHCPIIRHLDDFMEIANQMSLSSLMCVVDFWTLERESVLTAVQRLAMTLDVVLQLDYVLHLIERAEKRALQELKVPVEIEPVRE